MPPLHHTQFFLSPFLLYFSPSADHHIAFSRLLWLEGKGQGGKDFCLFCPVIASCLESTVLVSAGGPHKCVQWSDRGCSSRRISLPLRPWEQELPVPFTWSIADHLVGCLFLPWGARALLCSGVQKPPAHTSRLSSFLSAWAALSYSLSEPRQSLLTGCCEVWRGETAYGSNAVYGNAGWNNNDSFWETESMRVRASGGRA